MGETTQIEFTQHGARQLQRAFTAALAGADVVRELARPAGPAMPAAALPPDEHRVWGLVKPDGEYVAYLDGEGTQRWVNVRQALDVPPTWRPLYVGLSKAEAGR